MPEISRPTSNSDAIKLEFVERKATAKEMMELTINLHLGGLSILATVFFLITLAFLAL
jgi:hypothetical protein